MFKIAILSSMLLLSTSVAAVTLLAQQSFADFEGLGLQAGGGGGTLDSRRWRIEGASDGNSAVGGSTTQGDLARGLSPGAVRRGGLYAFSLPAGQRGLGIQATGEDFTPGTLTWTIANSTHQWLEELVLSFELWWRNDGARSSAIETQASFDGTSWISLANTLTPLASDQLGWQVTPHVLTPGWSPRTATLPAKVSQQVAPDANVWLRWRFDDAPGKGSRDEIALSALHLSAVPLAGSSPEPSVLSAPPTVWCIAAFAVLLSVRRGRARTSPSCNATVIFL